MSDSDCGYGLKGGGRPEPTDQLCRYSASESRGEPDQPPAPGARVDVITFTTDISEYSVTRLIGQASEAMNQGVEGLVVMLSSGGGDLPAAFTAYNFLMAAPIAVTTYNIGNIESSTNLIFLAGRLRVAAPTSQFMLHGINSPANAFTRSEILAQSERLDLDISRYAEVFRARTHRCALPIDIESCLGGLTRYLSPAEAGEAGLVNGRVEDLSIPPTARWRNIC